MNTKEDFTTALDTAFADRREILEAQGETHSESPYVFLAESVFGFVLYDTEKYVQWSTEMLAVIRAILSGTTFEMIEDPVGYEVFLKMANMPFMQDMLEWGGSIRGAWFDDHGDKRYFELSCGITIERCDLKVFAEALLVWAENQKEIVT